MIASPQAVTLLTLDAAQMRAAHGELVELLGDAVADGASMGFMMPLDHAGMRRYWSETVSTAARRR